MIDVTCAIIRNEEHQVLIVQRGEKTDHPFKWEFPGGKVAPGETEEECIIREIQEEISVRIVICSRLQPVEHNYGHKRIRLIPFVCDTIDELPLLTEHLDYRWMKPGNILSVDFSEADIFVARQYLEFVHERPYATAEVYDELSPEDDQELQTMIYRLMSRKDVEWAAKSAIENPVFLKKLMEYSLSPDKKLAFKASWTLTKVCDKSPSLLQPFLKMIISELDKSDNESSKRSFLRILSFADLDSIDQDQHGLLADQCFLALNSAFSAIAIKAYSMEILYKLAIRYPELANELSASISMLGDDAAGVKARGHIILKKLVKNLNPEQD